MTGPMPARPPADLSGAVVLFVDDDPELLAGLRRTLHMLRPAWRTRFATSGAEALDVLDRERIDIVVSDMIMPGMTGAQLLAQARERFPGVARLILSGHSDLDSVIAALGPSQQFLCKPIQAPALVEALDRLLGLEHLLDDQSMRDLLRAVTFVPKPADACLRLAEVVTDPGTQLGEIAELVSSDVTLSAEVLRLANSSSLVAGPATVGSVAQAVMLLGLATLRALVEAGGPFCPDVGFPAGIDGAELSRRGRRAATDSRRIAEAEHWPADAIADVVMAGLLHDLGLPILATALPQRWPAAGNPPSQDPRREHDYYLEHLGCAPAHASAYLLGSWGFPDATVQALADQPALPGAPGASAAGLLLTFVRNSSHAAWEPDGEGYLDADRLRHWQQILADQPAQDLAEAPHT